MAGLKKQKSLIIYAIVLTALILATPIFAGVLNSFSPGETISSSAVNQNFSMLNDDLEGVKSQINELCLLPGQVVFAAHIQKTNSGAELIGDEFICSDLNVSLSPSFDSGAFRLNLVGLETSDLIPMVVPNSQGAATPLACDVNPEQPTFFRFSCRISDTNMAPSSPDLPRYYVTLIRK